ncbi:MAG TPA: hypothetical protein VN457_01445, partial [Chlamydiales bacterium]|nr:hypothetical protein [Chlamydiales bacterium]
MVGTPSIQGDDITWSPEVQSSSENVPAALSKGGETSRIMNHISLEPRLSPTPTFKGLEELEV